MHIINYNDIKFATVHNKDLFMDISVPDCQTKPPLFIWIHGGSWRNGSYKKNPFNWLADEGYAVASISYRFTNIDIFPAQIQDVKQAIRFLRKNADKYGFDPEKIVAGGGSSGAHLAILAGLTADVKDFDNQEDPNIETSAQLNGILNLYGPTDFVLRAKEQPHTATSPERGSFTLLGGKEGSAINMKLARQASPANYVTKDAPPILSIHGTADNIVFPTQAKRITDAYKDKGAQADLILVPDTGHGAPECINNYKNEIKIFLTQCCHKPQIILHDYKQLEDGTHLKIKALYPDNYKPDQKQYPAIVFYFGGGWNGGTYDHLLPQAKYFSSKGYIVYNVQYRTKSSHGTTPRIALEDARSAMRWIKSHAETENIDLNNIFAGGGSSGGCLAAALGFESDINDINDDLSISTKPNGLILFNPVYDNSANGYGYDRVKDYWEDFSPMNNLSSNTPPTFVVLGTEDTLVPAETAEKYKSVLENYNVYTELHLYENRKHGFFNPGRSGNMNPNEDFVDTLMKAEKFLNKIKN